MKTETIIILIMVIISIILIIKLFKEKLKRKTAVEESETLRTQKQDLEVEGELLRKNNLKFQMKPHTINNIMINLKVIANNLNRGMDAMTETLDYILYEGENHLVSVGDELNFINQYLNLNDALSTEIDSMKIDDRGVNVNSKYYNAYCIPHLVSAYFIENAFKHGDKNHPNFLNVKVILTDDRFELKVTNKIKTTHVGKTKNGGIGLKNMHDRLNLIIPDCFEIRNSEGLDAYSSKLIINF